MKAIITSALLIFIIGNIGAADIESYQFIDRLRAMSRPGKPEIFEDSVLFTAPSSYRRIGISFAHDGYARVHWLRQLMIPRDSSEYILNGKLQKGVEPNIDSGIMFHLEPIPAELKYMDYRMVIDGLWTTDPLNPLTANGSSGIVESRVSLPAKPIFPPGAQSGFYRFSFRAPPGETITVAGSFNNWDPFMYELREMSPGFYTLSLPLSPGLYQYVYFYRGEQMVDPENFRKIYTREGRVVSEVEIQR